MSLIPVGSVFVKKPSVLVGGVLTETVPKLNTGQPDTYSEFAGVTVRDMESVTESPSVVRLQSTGFGLALVTGPVSAGDNVGIKQDIDTLAGDSDVPVGVALQDVAGPVDDPDTKLIRVRFGVGGGTPGKNSKRFRVKSVHGDYLTCRAVSGDTETAGDVYVAKPPELRRPDSGTWTQVVEGVTLTFTYTTRLNNLDGRRMVEDGGLNTQYEIVIPVYQVAEIGDGLTGTVGGVPNVPTHCDEIFADEPEGGTGVVVGGVTVTYMDTNRSARAWCQIA